MLSYVFQNGTNKREEIIKLCESEFSLKTIRNNENCTYLVNKLLTILIKNDYTHIILKNENVNIKKIESIF